MDPNLRLERHREYLRERRGLGIRALNNRLWYIKAKYKHGHGSSGFISEMQTRLSPLQMKLRDRIRMFNAMMKHTLPYCSIDSVCSLSLINLSNV